MDETQRFHDRREAGQLLARQLADYKDRDPSSVVSALRRTHNGRGHRMRRREIAREEWQAFFDSFNGQHEGWLVGIDRFNEFLDESVETRHLDGALRGVQSDDGSIALAVDDRSSGHLETESIQHPQRIVLEQSEDEVDTALEIDGPQSCIILRFRNPMPAEMVDGIAG